MYIWVFFYYTFDGYILTYYSRGAQMADRGPGPERVCVRTFERSYPDRPVLEHPSNIKHVLYKI